MKVLLHYQGTRTTGVVVQGHCFGTVTRFCENDIEKVLQDIEDTLVAKNVLLKGPVSITFITPLQDNEEGIPDSKAESLNNIITSICGENLLD